jgi:hypothetical protein
MRNFEQAGSRRLAHLARMAAIAVTPDDDRRRVHPEANEDLP